MRQGQVYSESALDEREPGQQRRPRVLLVEDTPADAVLIRRAYAAHWCHANTLERAKREFRAGDFEAIVCDLSLQNTGGADTLESVRAFAPVCPLVAISSEIDRKTAHSLIGAGADSYLHKRDLGQLGEAVQLAWAHRRRLQESVVNVATHPLQQELLERAATGPELFHFIQSGVVDGLWFWDLESGEEWHSDTFVESLGLSPDEVAGRPGWWRERVVGDDLERATEVVERHLAGESPHFEQLIRYRHRDGSVLWFRCRGRAVRDAAGTPIRMLGSFSNVTAIKNAEHQLRVTAMTDELTGLPNGRAIQSKCIEALARARRRREKAALLYFDIDRFKAINDRLGHDCGDRVLAAVAARARTALRELDTLGRLHGDEFLVIAEGLRRLDDAEVVAQRLLSAVGTPVHVAGARVDVSISVGVALYPDHGDCYAALRCAADKAMLKAKRDGRNTFAAALSHRRLRRVL